MSHLFDKRVLVLNKNWQPINEISPAEAFSMMAADAATGLDTSDNSFVPTKWKDWLTLPVRESDDTVKTSRGLVRVPRIIVSMNYAQVVVKKPRLTMTALRQRDGDRDAYTGKKLRPKDCSMEHVLPKSKGGKKTWENIVLVDRELNSKRGNRPLEEVGLKLRVKPAAPKPALPADRIAPKFPEWETFLKKKVQPVGV